METKAGDNIRAERTRFRVTQRELAEFLGLFPSTVIEVEMSKLEISQPEFVRWLSAVTEIAARKQQQAGEKV